MEAGNAEKGEQRERDETPMENKTSVQPYNMNSIAATMSLVLITRSP